MIDRLFVDARRQLHAASVSLVFLFTIAMAWTIPVVGEDRLPSPGFRPRTLALINATLVVAPGQTIEKGRVVIFGAGTGNPYFTTDTAASLRAMEIDAEVLIKATKVDAVYDKDPKKHADARRFDRLTYIDALNMRVGVMDSTAMAMCMDNDLPICVVNLWDEDTLVKVVMGEQVGTIITA